MFGMLLFLFTAMMVGGKKKKNAPKAVTGKPKPARQRPQGEVVSYAPLAGGLEIPVRKPRMVKLHDNGTAIEWAGCEYIADVDGETDPSTPTSYRLNPAATTFSILSSIATNFEMYRWTKLRFIFRAARPATEGGKVVAYVEYDLEDNPPSTKNEYLNHQDSAEGQVWKDFELVCTPANLNKKLFTRAEQTVGTGFDPRLDDLGKLFIAASGYDSANFPHEIFVEYSVILYGQQVPTGVAATVLAIDYVAATPDDTDDLLRASDDEVNALSINTDDAVAPFVSSSLGFFGVYGAGEYLLHVLGTGTGLGTFGLRGTADPTVTFVNNARVTLNSISNVVNAASTQSAALWSLAVLGAAHLEDLFTLGITAATTLLALRVRMTKFPGTEALNPLEARFNVIPPRFSKQIKDCKRKPINPNKATARAEVDRVLNVLIPARVGRHTLLLNETSRLTPAGESGVAKPALAPPTLDPVMRGVAEATGALVGTQNVFGYGSRKTMLAIDALRQELKAAKQRCLQNPDEAPLRSTET